MKSSEERAALAVVSGSEPANGEWRAGVGEMCVKVIQT